MITVADIRKAIEGLPDDATVMVDCEESPDEWYAALQNVRRDKQNKGVWLDIAVLSTDEDGEEECELCQCDYSPGGDGWDGFCPECADKVSNLMDFLEISRDEAKDILDNHSNWHHDGVEDGEDLYRFDMPEVQVQLFIGVKDEEADPLETNGEYRLFIENDVRDAGGEKRIRYACDQWKSDKAEVVKLLTMRDAAEIEKYLTDKVDYVKTMPNDPKMIDKE